MEKFTEKFEKYSKNAWKWKNFGAFLKKGRTKIFPSWKMSWMESGIWIMLRRFHTVRNFLQIFFYCMECMENGANGLILTQKREYHGKFSTEFFLSLMCQIYAQGLVFGRKNREVQALISKYSRFSWIIYVILEKNVTFPT